MTQDALGSVYHLLSSMSFNACLCGLGDVQRPSRRSQFCHPAVAAELVEVDPV